MFTCQLINANFVARISSRGLISLTFCSDYAAPFSHPDSVQKTPSQSLPSAMPAVPPSPLVSALQQQQQQQQQQHQQSALAALAAQGGVRPDLARSLYDQNVMREMQMNLLRWNLYFLHSITFYIELQILDLLMLFQICYRAFEDNYRIFLAHHLDWTISTRSCKTESM